MLVDKPSYEENHWTRGTVVDVRRKYVANYMAFHSFKEYQTRRMESIKATKNPESPRVGWLTRHLSQMTLGKDA